MQIRRLGGKSTWICPRCGTRTFLWAEDAHADRRLDAHGRSSGRPTQAPAFPLPIVPDARGFPLAQQVPMGHAAAWRHAHTMLSFTMPNAARFQGQILRDRPARDVAETRGNRQLPGCPGAR